jgi:hypothetical protein
MRGIVILFLSFLLISGLGAQTWNGDGDGHSWDDPDNWNNDQVPQTGDQVTIGIDASIDGTMSNVIEKIGISSNSTVTLDLNITISGTGDQHGIVVNGGATLNLGTATNNRVFNISVPTGKDAIAAFGSSSNVAITLASSSTLTISQCNNGINLAGANYSFTNDGTISISNNTGIGIRAKGVDGTFDNSGSISISNYTGNDGIAIEGGGTFDNNGELSIDDDPTTSGKNGIEVISGTYNNNNGSSLIVTSFANNWALLINGTFNNEKGGVLESNDRFRVDEAGTFTNNGLLISRDAGSGVWMSTGAVANNNGFYRYDNANVVFSGGAVDDDSNNFGTRLQNDYTANIASGTGASNDCQVRLCAEDHTWTGTDGPYNNESGEDYIEFTQTYSSLDLTNTDYNSYGNIVVTVTDICETTLNVDLIWFTTSRIDQTNLIAWQVVNEFNLSRYEVERSHNGYNFETIGSVETKNVGIENESYNFIDNKPYTGSNYYRLAIIDADGNTSYSKIEHLYTTKFNSDKNLVVYPTKVQRGSTLSITADISLADPALDIRIYDINGRLVISDHMKSNFHQINLSDNLNNGVYQLIAIDGKDRYKQRFIITQ